jgi:hypothetical protein
MDKETTIVAATQPAPDFQLMVAKTSGGAEVQGSRGAEEQRSGGAGAQEGEGQAEGGTAAANPDAPEGAA